MQCQQTNRERLVVLMDEHHLCVADVARLTFTSVSTVYGWLNESANFPDGKLDHLESKIALQSSEAGS